MLLQRHKRKIFFSWIMALLLMQVWQNTVYAQMAPVPLSDSIQHKLDRYRQMRPASKLFVHFDKTVYTNNENIWFTAYLLQSADPDAHHTLSVCLVNDIDHEIALQERFVMMKGVAFGNVQLTDSIPPGNYTFMLYTNWQVGGQPDAFFTQPVTIKTTATSPFKAILSLQDTAQSSYNKARRVLLTVNGNDYLPVPRAEVEHKITGNDTSVLEQKTFTDKAGQLIIPVPAGKNMIKAQVKVKKNSQYLYLALPQKQHSARVKFYAEGGNLIHKQISKIGWEATDNGTPLKVTGLLYDDDRITDTISTDSYGMGSFRFFPQAGHRYRIKLVGVAQKDTSYDLPVILPQGMTINMANALANDTLHLNVRSSNNSTLYLHVHNYQQEFFCVPVTLQAYIARKVNIALTDLPRGIAEVTLTDSLGKPYAERLFFAHYDKRQQLSIKAGKDRYTTREKVNIELSLRSKTADDAYVSIACVQDNRLEMKKKSDIESYFYLKSEIGDLPLKEQYFGSATADRSYLENILLIKGWRRYTWPDLLGVKTADTATKQASLAFTGNITVGGKPLKKPANMIIFRDSSSSLLITDARGHFTLDHTQLINTQDKEVKFLPTSERDYSLNINDPYALLNSKLARTLPVQSFERSLSTLTTENFALKGMARTIQLKEVTISAKKDNSLYALGPAGMNECGDYVCMYGILNCRNHPGQGTAPIAGHSYQGKVYLGCIIAGKREEEAKRTMPGIYVAREFYGSDYSVANPTAPEYFSTIFWKHLIKVDGNKPTHLSFYTSDIAGKFRIIVQGVTRAGVVYSEQVISIDNAKTSAISP